MKKGKRGPQWQAHANSLIILGLLIYISTGDISGVLKAVLEANAL